MSSDSDEYQLEPWDYPMAIFPRLSPSPPRNNLRISTPPRSPGERRSQGRDSRGGGSPSRKVQKINSSRGHLFGGSSSAPTTNSSSRASPGGSSNSAQRVSTLSASQGNPPLGGTGSPEGGLSGSQNMFTCPFCSSPHLSEGLLRRHVKVSTFF